LALRLFHKWDFKVRHRGWNIEGAGGQRAEEYISMQTWERRKFRNSEFMLCSLYPRLMILGRGECMANKINMHKISIGKLEEKHHL
jgi:hypothetical protein